jgi:hypothetical protein
MRSEDDHERWITKDKEGTTFYSGIRSESLSRAKKHLSPHLEKSTRFEQSTSKISPNHYHYTNLSDKRKTGQIDGYELIMRVFMLNIRYFVVHLCICGKKRHN